MMEVRRKYDFILILMALTIGGNITLYAQNKQLIRGKVQDQNSYQPVANATVSLHTPNDSSFINGTISDTSGTFILETEYFGKAFLKISFVGFKPFLMNIDIAGKKKMNLALF